jgi:hypothetical protein
MANNRTLVFTGHRIDAPGRAKPRFPAAAESTAREMIRQAVESQLDSADTPISAIAGAASGGDILFHEVCDELNIPSEAHLAKPPSDYIEASVADGGPDWIARFAAITASRPVHVLAETDGDGDLSVWDRSNLEMLDTAKERAGDGVTLIALWNGEGGDGPGGTAGMVKRVRERGGQAIVLDAKELLPRPALAARP